MSLNDLRPIAELRKRQAFLFDNAIPAVNPRKILLYSVDTWQLGLFEQFLHLAFQLKGHNPRTVYDDGLLPISGWENNWVAPPAVDTLKNRANFIFSSFGIPAVGISRFLEKNASCRRAERIIDSAAPTLWRALEYRGIQIGRIALRDLFQYSMGYFEPHTADEFTEYRRHLIHAIMSVDLAYAICEIERPDIVVLVNGKLVMYSYMYEVARYLGIETTTWEEGMYFDTSIRLAHNAKAIDFAFEPIVWEVYRRRPVDPAAIDQVEQYFKRWRNQTATHYKYYLGEVRDASLIRHELNLPGRGRVISIFTNILWDSNALEKDDAFNGMMDWVFTTIDVVARIPEATLVIRAHPGEYKCCFKTRTPVRSMILQRYGDVPSHVRIVDGDSELSSYEIAALSDRSAVYTSTLGIETTLMGLQPLICGVPFYSHKGFTNDVRSKSHYERLLRGLETPTSANPELLKRFMYLIIFELVKSPEFFIGIHDTPQRPIVRIDTFEGFPDSMPVFNQIVDRILDRKSFIQLSEASEAQYATAH